MKKLAEFKSVRDFLLNAPLYERFAISEEQLEELCGKVDRAPFDGHCPYCHQQTTWSIHRNFDIPAGQAWNEIDTYSTVGYSVLHCARNRAHTLRFEIRLSSLKIQKYGQYPSLASIANDEIAPYRKRMSERDGVELYEGIGLAAHGAGIAAFVYLRRVFERLVFNRFEEFKEAEGWSAEEFRRLDMVDRVKLLSNHLPPFLVENARIYGILSLGIHELDDERCLGAFEMLRESIFIILDEDEKKRAELERRKRLSSAISSFDPKPSS